MLLSRGMRLAVWVLGLAVLAAPLSGCGGDVPDTGTQASPVNEEQAAQQRQAYSDFAKSKGAEGGSQP